MKEEDKEKIYDAGGIEISAKEELLYADIRMRSIYGSFIVRAKLLGYADWWIGEQLAEIAYGYLEACSQKEWESENEK